MKKLILSFIAAFAAAASLHAHCGTCSTSEMNNDDHHADSQGGCYDGKLTSYFSIQTALASDDLAAAKNAASTLCEAIASSSCSIEGEDCCAETCGTADTIASAKDIGVARQAFKGFSDALIAKLDSHGCEDTAYKMFCPMAFDNQGAAWLQDSTDLRNPYFGATMLTCGKQTAAYGPGATSPEPTKSESH